MEQLQDTIVDVNTGVGDPGKRKQNKCGVVYGDFQSRSSGVWQLKLELEFSAYVSFESRSRQMLGGSCVRERRCFDCVDVVIF